MIYDEWVFHDVEHIYLQLIKKIGCAIYSGQLSTGEKIPSVREMAKILYINPNTVMSAYKIVSNDKAVQQMYERCRRHRPFHYHQCQLKTCIS